MMKKNALNQRRNTVCLSLVFTAAAFTAWIATDSIHVAAQQQQRRGGQAPAAGSQSEPSAEHGGEAPAPQAPAPGGGGGARGGLVAYPDRPKAPQDVLDRGKATFSVNCAFCHGSDAGGGSVGPNLWRSEVVLQDKRGELIAPIVHGGRSDRGMPKIDITDAQIGDIADWLHSIKISSRTLVRENINIVVGDATTGKAAFDRTCGSCHKVDGDLKGFAARYTDPRAMQQAWIMPGGGGGRGGPGGGGNAVPQKVSPVTATVTPTGGKAVTGRLEAIDDFYVAVVTPDGETHRFIRNGEASPKVELKDPLAPHRELLRKYDDKDIHDITAYLNSLK